MTEIFDVVDEEDNVIGQATRQECHQKGLLHRAVHVLIFNSGGELLLQQRSLKMDTAPGYWTGSATGHVKSGDDYLETAHRELGEDLGIKIDLHALGKVACLLPEHMQMVKFFSGIHNGPFKIDLKELEKVEFVKIGKIKRDIRLTTRKFTPAFLEVFRKFCEVKRI